VRAEPLAETAMRALVEEVQVEVAERREESIRIVALPGVAVGEAEAEAVSRRHRPPREEADEEPALAHERVRPAVRPQHLRADRVGMPRPHDHALATVDARGVRAEDVVRRRVRSADQARTHLPIEGGRGTGHPS
jgi:hypothetical protein